MIQLLFAGLCRRLKFSTKIDEHALQFHVIKKFDLSIYVGPSVRSACTHRCIMNPVCVSVNIGLPTDEKFICELSDSDHTKHPEDLKKREGFLYIGTEVIRLLSVEDIFSCFLYFKYESKCYTYRLIHFLKQQQQQQKQQQQQQKLTRSTFFSSEPLLQ